MIKAILLDIDGTLTNDEKQITARTAEALKAAQAHGVKLVLASGRADVGLHSFADVLDMKDYFRKYINNAQAFYSRDSNFFERLALVVRRIPVTDYADIFSNLWSKEDHLSKLYERLLRTMRRLNFAEDIYLPVEAVLHHGVNENTIMSVQCLNGLADEEAQPRFTHAFLRNGDSYSKVENLNKSEMSAICAEVVFRIGDDFLESSSSYDFEMITDPLGTV